MGEVIPFDFEARKVRVVVQNFETMFVGLDVCRAIGISKHRDAFSRLDEDEGRPVVVDTLGGPQSMFAVTQSGLFALILLSRKPAAKRFRKWVTSEVLPALLRDGFYRMPGTNGADHARLNARRAYAASVPATTQAVAAARAAAVQQVEALVARGMGSTAAVREVSGLTGIAVRTLWAHWRNVVMVAEADMQAALTPLWHQKRGMLAPCHPEALRLFSDLLAAGVKVAVAYRRLADVAEDRGWGRLPSERTMYRAAKGALALPRPAQPPKSKVA